MGPQEGTWPFGNQNMTTDGCGGSGDRRSMPAQRVVLGGIDQSSSFCRPPWSSSRLGGSRSAPFADEPDVGPAALAFRQGSLRPAAIMARLSRCSYEPLISSNAWQVFARTAEDMPFPVHTLFVECRLQDGVTQTDFGVGLFPGVEAACWASRLAHVGRRVEERRFAGFLEQWASLRSPWCRDVPFLFLAFDGGSYVAAAEVPCVSLCIDAHFFARRDGLDEPPRVTAERVLELVRCSHRELTGVELPVAACERLERLAMGHGVESRHASIMLARPSAPAKLDVRLPLSELTDYVERAGWSRGGPIYALLRELVPFGEHVQLNLPLDPAPVHRLEVEVLSGRARVTREQRFAFLERLVDRGIAASEKVRALRRIHEQPLIELEAGSVLGANFYVKLCFERSELKEAKAYVGFMPMVLPGLMAREFQQRAAV